MKEIVGKSFKWHFCALITSVVVVSFCLFVLSKELEKGDNSSKEELAAIYEAFPFKSYYYMYQNDHNEAYHALKSTLESGGIAMFGSSELTSNKSRFTTYNFFPGSLGIDLKAFGHAGFQGKAILTELMSAYSPEALENGRVVILLSPSWYQTGERMHEGLWRKEVASSVVLSRVRENEFVPDELKKEFLGSEADKNILSELDDVLRQYVDRKFLQSTFQNRTKLTPSSMAPEWEKWKEESLAFEKGISTNDYGINDEYYNLHVKRLVGTSKFPFEVSVNGTLETNQEIKDFNLLLKVLEKFKHKPLFVILPLNRKAYRNLEILDPTIAYLENKIKEKDYPLLNFWPMPYHEGVLTDVMHNGAYGWVLINEFIYQNQLQK